jgi:hypothetical protein
MIMYGSFYHIQLTIRSSLWKLDPQNLENMLITTKR